MKNTMHCNNTSDIASIFTAQRTRKLELKLKRKEGDILYADGPDTDKVVREATEQCLAIRGPCEGHALRLLRVLANIDEIGLELINNGFALEIKYLDAAGGRGAKPVSVGGEDEGVDGVTSLERVQVLAIVEIPQHRDAVLATRSSQRSIGGNGDSVNVTSVAVVVGAQLALGKLPDLDYFVPTTGDNDRVAGVRAESNT